MQVSIVVPDISSNAMARACPIADALSTNHSIKIYGFDQGEGFFDPYEGEFDYETVSAGVTPVSLYRGMHEIERALSGDVCYAFRPLIGSLGVGLLHKKRTGTPLILDVEDILRFHNRPWYQKMYNTVRSAGSPVAESYSMLLERRLDTVDSTTVTSKYLKEKYGGHILPYGPDETDFSPDRVNPHPNLVDEYADEQVIVFVGTIRPHKGLDVLATAVDNLSDDVRLVIAGFDPHKIVPELEALADGRVDFLGPISHDKVPSFLDAADAVAIPQKKTEYTKAQIPNKLFEAMAMGTPIVVSDVSDLADIVGDCGIVVEPSDAGALTEGLRTVLADGERAQRMGKCARDRYVERYGRSVLRERIKEIVESTLDES